MSASLKKRKKSHKILFYVTLKDITRESPCSQKFVLLSSIAHLEKFWRVAML